MKKNDLIIISVIAVLALALFVFLKITDRTGACAVVTVDGVEEARFDLSADTEYEIKSAEGVNHLVIKEGYAYLKDADCPDKLCVKMGRINKEGQSIICLPHKVVIEIKGGEENDVDVMVR